MKCWIICTTAVFIIQLFKLKCVQVIGEQLCKEQRLYIVVCFSHTVGSLVLVWGVVILVAPLSTSKKQVILSLFCVKSHFLKTKWIHTMNNDIVTYLILIEIWCMLYYFYLCNIKIVLNFSTLLNSVFHGFWTVRRGA